MTSHAYPGSDTRIYAGWKTEPLHVLDSTTECRLVGIRDIMLLRQKILNLLIGKFHGSFPSGASWPDLNF